MTQSDVFTLLQPHKKYLLSHISDEKCSGDFHKVNLVRFYFNLTKIFDEELILKFFLFPCTY